MLVRFCVDYRIKPHVPPFNKVPANSVKFQPCDCTTQAEYFYVSLHKQNSSFIVWITRVSNPHQSPYLRGLV